MRPTRCALLVWHRHASGEAGLAPHRHADAVSGHVHLIPFRGSTGPMVDMAGPGCAVASAQGATKDGS